MFSSSDLEVNERGFSQKLTAMDKSPRASPRMNVVIKLMSTRFSPLDHMNAGFDHARVSARLIFASILVRAAASWFEAVPRRDFLAGGAGDIASATLS